MRSLSAIALLTVGSAHVLQRGGDVGVPLKAIYTTLTDVEHFDRWDQSKRASVRATVNDSARSERYYTSRQPAECNFPLEIVILQDLTDSFSDNIEEMKNVQLKQMVAGLSASHPGSKFTVIGFQDKAIPTYGNRDDACWVFTSDFSTDYEGIYNTYANFKTYGGADAPENQFGAIMAALDTDKIKWSPTTSEYSRLIVVVTDAGPHHAEDGVKPADGSVLAPWPGMYSDANAADLCLKTGYPSAQQMYNRIVAKETYIASLVFDGDWANGWAANEWRTFNRFLAQPAGFVEQDAEDSSTFWASLSNIITELENIECIEPTTSTPAPTVPTTASTVTNVGPPVSFTTPATTAITLPPPVTASTTRVTLPPPVTASTAGPVMTTTSMAPVVTTAATTAAPPKPTGEGECHPTVIVDGECVPAPENCFCHPDVLIKLAYKPDSLNLVADDKVVAQWGNSD